MCKYLKEKFKQHELQIKNASILLTAILLVYLGIYFIRFVPIQNKAPFTPTTTPSDLPTINVNDINPDNNPTTTISKTDWELFSSNQYNKIKIYQNGFETPSSYISNPVQGLSSAGRKIITEGKIEDAYIYIIAGANDINGKFSPVDPAFDGVWFYIKDGFFSGGQLNLAKSRRGETTQYTELLYSLKKVPVALDLKNYRLNNFTDITNLSDELKGINYIAALVSTERYGKIINLEVGYKCSSSTPNCSIKLVK